MDLSGIIRTAQGGQAVDNLAQQFGLSTDQVERAVSALLPALSQGFLAKATTAGGIGDLIGHLFHPDHEASFSDPVAAQANGGAGATTASAIFGSNSVVGQLIERASAVSGISSDTLRQMLPVLISIVAGGVARSMNNQGFGGVLGQLADAARSGNLGSLFGQPSATAGSPDAAQGSGSGWGGLAGAVLGSLFGGSGSQPQTPASAPVDAPKLHDGLKSLTDTLQPGDSADPDLQRDISSILGGR